MLFDDIAAKRMPLLSRRQVSCGLLASALLPSATLANARQIAPPLVAGLLGKTDSRLDYAEAALAIDAMIDPAADLKETSATIARLIDAARQMAGPTYKLAAIRKAIYDAGPWNYGKHLPTTNRTRSVWS